MYFKLYSVKRKLTHTAQHKEMLHRHTRKRKPSATVGNLTCHSWYSFGWMTLSGSIFSWKSDDTTPEKLSWHNLKKTNKNCTFFSVYYLFVCFFFNFNVDSCRSLVSGRISLQFFRWWWHFPPCKEIKKSFVLYTHKSLGIVLREVNE
jgi:hypothetical protein